MLHYLIIIGFSGFGRKRATQPTELHKQVTRTFYKNKPALENPHTHFHCLNILEDILSPDFLPDELTGLVYCPVGINLRPSEKINQVEFEGGLSSLKV